MSNKWQSYLTLNIITYKIFALSLVRLKKAK